MAKTSSLIWPSMFNISQNQVAVYEDNQSIVNRTRLLILTEPKELYHNPQFGVGLRRHLWKYNTENEKALITDRIINQLRLHEPYVVPEETSFADGLLFTGSDNPATINQEYNHLKMTVALQTTYKDVIDLEVEMFGETQSDYD